ncbi:MAG: hypothetical protein H6Q78_1341, partial [Candidatus Krumholzibacteriota bacterium]|nr:hypothetical protein [Candidatus Krumholzibacteriota bacterium]
AASNYFFHMQFPLARFSDRVYIICDSHKESRYRFAYLPSWKE